MGSPSLLISIACSVWSHDHNDCASPCSSHWQMTESPGWFALEDLSCGRWAGVEVRDVFGHCTDLSVPRINCTGWRSEAAQEQMLCCSCAVSAKRGDAGGEGGPWVLEHCRGAETGCWSWNSGWVLSITSPTGNCSLVGEFSAGPGNQKCVIHPDDPRVCPAPACRNR